MATFQIGTKSKTWGVNLPYNTKIVTIWIVINKMAYTSLQSLHNSTKVLEMITRRHSSISKSALNLTTKGILYNKVHL